MKDCKTNTRGRPKELHKRGQILQASGELFIRQGFQHTSMDQIAVNADVSKQTIYSYFNNKEQLFAEVISHKVRSYQIEEGEEIPLTPIQPCLEELGKRFLDLVMDPECIYITRVVIAESIEYPKMAELFYKNGPQRVIQFLSSYLQRLDKEHGLHIKDPAKAAVMYIGLLKGHWYLENLMNVGSPITRRAKTRHINECARMFIRLIQTNSV